MVEISIQLISPNDAELLDAAFALYSAAIEKTEQRPEDVFRALASHEDYRFVAAVMDEKLIGIAVSWIPPDSGFWLFEYAAVDDEMRGRGVGANLFFATRMLAGQERAALIEVDADLGSPEQAKRLNFYRRLGCRRVGGLDYQLPLDAFGRPPPMWLLVMAQQETMGVSVFALEDWLRRIYAEAYGKGLDDPRLAQMIDPLPDVVALERI
jgi:GNAT superfamily N-acetyltransferase